MFLNIITPCSRPENLHLVANSINIPIENYRWIVVFDSEELPNQEMIPSNCEAYSHKDLKSTSGNSQRNYALSLVTDGHVYFNDDDTIMHPELWDEIKDLDNDFISFSQNKKDGTLHLKGDTIQIGGIDSHNFIVSKQLIGESRWNISRYEADGQFASECYGKSTSFKFIPKVLSTYNYLR